MKLNRSIIGLAAAIAMMAVLTGCGKSTSTTDPGPVLDTTPPPAVSGLSIFGNPVTGHMTLAWSPSAAPDVANYEVHGVDGASYVQLGSTPDYRFELPEANLSDTYAVRAVDISGNRGPFALYTVGDVSEDL